MNNRILRLTILTFIVLITYGMITSEAALSTLLPQIQVALVGMTKGVFGALLGALAGMILFPHKIRWDIPPNKAGIGAYARLILIVLFVWVAYNYA